jgi:hypothetical protein
MKDWAASMILGITQRAKAIFTPIGVITMPQYMMEHFGSFAQNWFQRRHASTQNKFGALQRVYISDKTDPTAMMHDIAEWQRARSSG